MTIHHFIVDASRDESLLALHAALVSVPLDKVERADDIADLRMRHLAGKHDQASHASRKGGGKGSPNLGIKGAAYSGLGTEADPIVTANIDAAASALGRGMYVRLSSERKVSTLVDQLGRNVQAAEAMIAREGEGAKPKYDLCKVTVPGTNVFCVHNKGIPRAQMPQLKGVPVKGSKADKMKRDKRGEVDLANGFVTHLGTRGVIAGSGTMDPAHLKASQSQLDGAKVAGIAGYLRRGGKLDGAIFVTSDDYVIDGHHRWAAEVSNEMRRTGRVPTKIKVVRLDIDISSALHLAHDYAEEMGIPQAAFGQMPDVTRAYIALADLRVRHLPGKHDQSTHGHGGGMGNNAALGLGRQMSKEEFDAEMSKRGYEANESFGGKDTYSRTTDTNATVVIVQPASWRNNGGLAVADGIEDCERVDAVLPMHANLVVHVGDDDAFPDVDEFHAELGTFVNVRKSASGITSMAVGGANDVHMALNPDLIHAHSGLYARPKGVTDRDLREWHGDTLRPGVGEIRHTVQHEYGHVIDAYAGGNCTMDFQVRVLKDGLPPTVSLSQMSHATMERQLDRAGITGYGKQGGPPEAFADSFAQHVGYESGTSTARTRASDLASFTTQEYAKMVWSDFEAANG